MNQTVKRRRIEGEIEKIREREVKGIERERESERERHRGRDSEREKIERKRIFLLQFLTKSSKQ